MKWNVFVCYSAMNKTITDHHCFLSHTNIDEINKKFKEDTKYMTQRVDDDDDDQMTNVNG
ncbi:hypothetical protein DERP_010384 [Dermatophagoides pteronyssinus]|uniref:Uncharacterized protein n=1 Tax=Dermatophagoides pteronyssinus TaxID=6956 RepID=A0ABQ8J5C8_DERPT|nr:hypothetical protein DERP_010384 [Dermatophagoides pteronyssinus]